jgi:hypothetical protein
MNSQIANKLSSTSSETEGKKHQAYAMEESRLNKAKKDCQDNGNCDEFNRLGGENRLKEVEGLVHNNQNANYQLKKTGMDAGRENQFIDKHEKDRDNANPTEIGGVPKVNKGSVKDKIMTNKEVYNEQINKEISSIRYLIEYMNNNKKQNL